MSVSHYTHTYIYAYIYVNTRARVCVCIKYATFKKSNKANLFNSHMRIRKSTFQGLTHWKVECDNNNNRNKLVASARTHMRIRTHTWTHRHQCIRRKLWKARRQNAVQKIFTVKHTHTQRSKCSEITWNGCTRNCSRSHSLLLSICQCVELFWATLLAHVWVSAFAKGILSYVHSLILSADFIQWGCCCCCIVK